MYLFDGKKKFKKKKIFILTDTNAIKNDDLDDIDKAIDLGNQLDIPDQYDLLYTPKSLYIKPLKMMKKNLKFFFWKKNEKKNFQKKKFFFFKTKNWTN